MNTPNQPLPRFIPTLTEVVDPRTLTGLAKPAQAETEAMVKRVKQQIQPIFERRLQEEFDRLVRATVSRHWADVSAKLQDEMEMFTRQAVIDALANPGPARPLE
ncbi:MAG: hypothetical protein KBF66_14860 [Rhodoferax sp.]|uniref:hypothetical protein n=1 Tax=Rhodoferax sp. TaxID=50421 RepID=UPI001B40D78D|nr:hypothetical protein [Rhodoferax sp.]MBP9906835.1 hypothetical protein [Rhodoferax sp.]